MTMLTYTKTNLCVAVSANNFCALYAAACGGIDKWDACDQEFGALAAGSGGEKADTQACRVYHLGLAVVSTDLAKIHCPHVSKAGADQCVTGMERR